MQPELFDIAKEIVKSEIPFDIFFDFADAFATFNHSLLLDKYI